MMVLFIKSITYFLYFRQTISLWLYIVEYCTEGRILCSIIQRLTWNERYCTPLVYITNKGVYITKTGGTVGESGGVGHGQKNH